MRNDLVKRKIKSCRKSSKESHGITIIRTNPDAADFDMNRLTNQIYKHIVTSTKKQAKVSIKKSLTDDLSKVLRI